MSEQSPATVSFANTSLSALLTAARTRIMSLAGRSGHEIEDAEAARAKNLADSNAHRAVDAATKEWLERSSLILAAYQELEPLAGRAEVLAILLDSLIAPFKPNVSRYLADRFGISANAPPEAFARISEDFKKRGEERFGQAFVYVDGLGNPEAQRKSA